MSPFFGSTFWDGPEGKGGVRIQNHFNHQISERLQLGFDTRYTLGEVRRMKIFAQMDPKSHPKIDIWAIRGPTFEVFGNVLRNATFL